MRSHFVALIDVVRTRLSLIGFLPSLFTDTSIAEFSVRLNACPMTTNFTLRNLKAVDCLTVAMNPFPLFSAFTPDEIFVRKLIEKLKVLKQFLLIRSWRVEASCAVLTSQISSRKS